MSYVLGMNGGGTRTEAWLADHRGRVLARAKAGPSNPLKVGFRAAQEELLRAAHSALRQAGVKGSGAAVSDRRRPSSLLERRHSQPMLEAVCVGLAGVDRTPVHRRIVAWLRKSIPAHHYLLTSDAAIALRAAIGKSPGAIVISGTGSIAFGQDESGHVLRSGGWGTVFDDAGSGYDLGRKAIVAALRAFDGRGPRTQLANKICRALKLRGITEVILWPLAPHVIAGLFPLVLDAARAGDHVARELCEQAGRDLAELAVALLKRLGWLRRNLPVVCAGGVFSSSLRVRRSFARHLRRYAPHARVTLLRRPAVEGAVALALELATSSQASG